jgi:D-3-phosphoglycerate dehydrogenase
MHVVIPDDYQDAVRSLACFAKLARHQVTIHRDSVRSIDALAARFRGADALVLIRERTAIGAELLDRLPDLRLICQTGRGVTHIDVDACTRHGVRVVTTAGSPVAPAELTWGLVLASMRRIAEEAAALKAGRWQTTLGVALRGRTLGIFGYGNIGRLVAGYGRAFGMRVLVWGREGSVARARQDGLDVAGAREALFESADILSLHVRLATATRGLVGAADLARMKPSSLFVNTSRAELVEPGALASALAAGRPGFAAVDVYDAEPALDDPLLRSEHALCTPHLGYVERDTYEQYFGAAFDQLNLFATGGAVDAINAGAPASGA